MSALEISEFYFGMASDAKDLRWKRFYLDLAQGFSREWFK